MSSKKQEIWYHGSPYKIEILREGSSITWNEKLAQAFSTRPEIVSVSDDGDVKHNGKLTGHVYRIVERIVPEDVYPHPKSSMDTGWEWITKREYRLVFLYEYIPSPEDILSEDEILKLQD